MNPELCFLMTKSFGKHKLSGERLKVVALNCGKLNGFNERGRSFWFMGQYRN
jgi:hypothetical protein